MSSKHHSSFSSRETHVGELLRDLLHERPTNGSILVIDDSSDQALPEGGKIDRWNRFAYHGQSAQAWIPEGPYQTIYLREPRQNDGLLFLLHAALSHLTPTGELIVYGLNDEGIRSLDKKTEGLALSTEALFSKHHGKAWLVKPDPKAALKKSLRDWQESFRINVNEQTLDLVTYPGTFAHLTLDPGTELLLQYLKTAELGEHLHVLDFGCGVGTISAFLRALHPNMSFDLLDVDVVALEAAKINVPGSNVFLADGLNHARLGTYELVVSNPPLHIGKEQTRDLLMQFLSDVADHLVPHGAVVFVIQKTIPIKRLAEQAPLYLKLKAENDVYQVWQGKRRGMD